MMPNITRGDRMGGLLVYLAGPGRSNEHDEQHLVAGDGALMQWYGDRELDRDDALAIARHLERPHALHKTRVKAGHVWHASLSLRAEEGIKSDELWGEIARDFIKAMEFDDVEGTKAACRWAAVRHGVSKNGNDHIHIVVNLVREDGTKARDFRDYRRAQAAARALEVMYGLEPLEGREVLATRGYDPAEREAQARARAAARYEQDRMVAVLPMPTWTQLTGANRHERIITELGNDQPRNELARLVRACSTASESEAEFVRRLRRVGLAVKPRYAKGTTDVVVGYAVARRAKFGENRIWYGGRSLARDLSLPRLRDGWMDTPQGATAAAAEWGAAMRERPVVAPGRELAIPDAHIWERYTADVKHLREHLNAVPLEDRDTWATVARYTAGAFAAWSHAVEDTPGDLAAAADTLARSAQTYRRPQKVNLPTSAIATMSGVGMVLAAAARGGQGHLAERAMIIQLIRLAIAVAAAAQAAGEVRQTQRIVTDVRARLERVHQLTPTGAGASDEAVPVVQAPVRVRPPLDPEAQAMLERVMVSARGPTTGDTSRPGRTSTGFESVEIDIEQGRMVPVAPGIDRGIER